MSDARNTAPATTKASFRAQSAVAQLDACKGPDIAIAPALPPSPMAEPPQRSLWDGALDRQTPAALLAIPRRFAVVRPRQDRPELAHPAPIDIWSTTSANDGAAFPGGSRPRNAASRRPLRVLDRRGPGAAARVLISGRMADVCAELDRLVRAEAAMQSPH
ncbi:hypothetical protein [Acidovorax sp. SUPP3334]|uniref:hypothetical protein n=1 Tax=Acidovorax sp. SUPP3334 TaxID=2920881 RepID=UPI0023DE34EB|nr:hypothetical protein [Acidovorax sp. SUPP3334]GKT21184.1 hypothetical protein AVHM3334_03940 [Acidovorax sp. SUPP3334]